MAYNTKSPVYLRRRERKNGLIALFLDMNIDGKRRYEYLKLYLVPENTRADKAANRETMRIAETIKAQRIIELQSHRLGIGSHDGSKILFFDFFASIIARKTGTTRYSWSNCMSYMERYEPDRTITFRRITPQWVQGFRDYLDAKARKWDIDPNKKNVKEAPLSAATKALIFKKLCAGLNLAVKQGIIPRNPASNVDRFKVPDSSRQFLTLDELRKLSHTPARDAVTARAFLFSCLTGLRWSDIVKLRWREVQHIGDATRLVFTQKKTGGLEYLDLNPQAVALMGERAEGEERIFPSLKVCSMQSCLARWVKDAGIDKHITFHCGRHTFAVMMLDVGVDIYTVSKLLGHKSINTTQVYAKILDKNKQAAVSRIPSILG